MYGININWLLTGEGPMEKTPQSKDNIVSEDRAIYNNKVIEDPELEEIIKLLKENPKDKKLVLKLLKGKKDIKEALEGFEIKKLLEEV